jgi:hypothetical protein
MDNPPLFQVCVDIAWNETEQICQDIMPLMCQFTAVRLKLEQNQLVDVFGEIGARVNGLKGA